ncbi:phage tail spike protein [Ruminococcus sp.]|uniref:phage tail spike protein n=1 Tax=Ruminococcus sp. TaxID=41978 RepID=UPI003F06CAD3
MVLKIFYNNESYLYKDIDKTFFRTRSYGGMMYLQFDISPDHELYKYIAEETELEYDGQRYVVKGINERKTATTINAELDLSGLDSKGYTEFTRKTESFYNVSRDILDGTGWAIVDAELVSKRTSLDLKDVTTREILEHCTNSTAYNTCYSFDTINKIIYCVKPQNNTTPTGTYFTDELNLTDMTFKGSSSGLVTKLYAFGKDGLDISSVNGGKRYIENHTYTDKVIVAIWRDDRYTDPQSLLDDAVVKLATLAVPERSYTAKVIDLAKLFPELYDEILNYDLCDVVTLIDRKRKTRINHRIVEVREYPADYTLNTVTMSTVAGKVSGKISTLESKVTTLNAEQLHDRTKVNEIKQDLDSTVLHVSESWASSENQSMFTQTAEGLYLEVDKVVGTNRWSTLLRQSATDIRIAWNNISKYIQFENAEINIYNSSDIKLMSLNAYGHDIYDSEGIKLMSLNSKGQEFFYKGNKVGYIGTGYYKDDTSKRDLSFNLENGSAFMDWCYRVNSTDSAYTLIFTYAANKTGSLDANQLHTGCDMNLQGHYLRNAVLKDFGFEGGSINGTMSGNYVTSFNSDGTAATWRTFSLTFKNGILQSATW